MDTVREPIVREAETKVGDSGLRLDLGVRSVWQSQAEALFDFKVIDTDAPSSRVLVGMSSRVLVGMSSRVLVVRHWGCW